jgi:hypothetical protein
MPNLRYRFGPRPRALTAALAAIIGTALLCLLFVPARDNDNLQLVFDWRPEIEPLALTACLAAMALMGRSLGLVARVIVASLVVVTALLQLADAAVLGALDRELDLYFDLRHVPALIGLVHDALGPWRGAALIGAVALGLIAAVVAIARLLGAVQRALRLPFHAALCFGIIAAALALSPVLRGGDGAPLIAHRTSIVLAEQGARLYQAYAVMHGWDQRYAQSLATAQPLPGKLPGLKQRDVFVVFFESYGTVALDNPTYAKAILPALADFAAVTEKAGYHMVSNRLVSPVFGGGSWLAHGSIDSGLKLDPFLSRLLTETKRLSWPRYMQASGYRTVVAMPGLKTPALEDDFWGFDHHYYAGDFHYAGPPFGWFDIPDQAMLRSFDAAELSPGHAPLFAQLVLVSSHTPFAPVPPYVADWSDAEKFRSVSAADWERIYAPPDWTELQQPYLDSVVYDLQTLAAWLAQRDGDALVIILGDHQPPGFISGQKQPWTVPVHVLSRDADLLRPFAAEGYVAGAVPPRDGEFAGMESFLGNFLAAFAHPPALASVPAAAATP